MHEKTTFALDRPKYDQPQARGKRLLRPGRAPWSSRLSRQSQDSRQAGGGPTPLVNRASIGAAVIGTGFIGTVHVEALRRIGVNVLGVLGSTAERGAARADALGVPKAYPSLDELLADDGRRRRPRHLAERPPRQPGRGGIARRQARGLREAARDDRRRVRGPRRARRPRPASSTRRTSTSATTR